MGRARIQFAVGQGVAEFAGRGLAQLDAASFHIEVEGFRFQVRHTADSYGHGMATAVVGVIGNGLHPGYTTHRDVATVRL